MGLAFLLSTLYLLPLTVTFLVLAVAALAFRAKRRRGYGPFVVELIAAIILLIGKFVIESEVALYGGITLLFGASIWNSWPAKSAKRGSACSAETLYQIGSDQSEVQHEY